MSRTKSGYCTYSGRKKMKRLATTILILLGLLGCGRPSESDLASSTPTREHPLIVAQDEGDVRVWRPLVTESPVEQKLDTRTAFIIKVDRKSGGSPDFWFGTETLPPGVGIPYHRHLHEDEVLYIVSGSAHVDVGSLKGDARPGTIVFIPRDTWVSVQPAGKTPISLLFAFNAGGFDRYMRCESVPLGGQERLVTIQEDRHCTQIGDVQYR
jgi:mannose-6-phosphate isomerase-like protein (cupin superfamily)